MQLALEVGALGLEVVSLLRELVELRIFLLQLQPQFNDLSLQLVYQTYFSRLSLIYSLWKFIADTCRPYLLSLFSRVIKGCLYGVVLFGLVLLLLDKALLDVISKISCPSNIMKRSIDSCRCPLMMLLCSWLML